MAVTKETVSSKIQELAKNSIHAAILEGKEDFELYNALVGTTFDAESYAKVADEAPEYLYDHIPGGSKMIKNDTEYDTMKKAEGFGPVKPGRMQETKPAPAPDLELQKSQVKIQEEIEQAEGVKEAITNLKNDEDLYNEEFDLDKDGDIDEDDEKIADEKITQLKKEAEKI